MAVTDFVHRGGAAPLTLSSPIEVSGNNPFTVAGDTSGWPTTEGSEVFVVTVDRGTGGEERMICRRAAGSSQLDIVARGGTFDLTGQASHDIGAVVEHTLSATELSEYNDHRALTTGTHGVSGTIVGTSDAQTLTNKVIDGSSGGTNTITVDQADVNGLTSRLTTAEDRITTNESGIASNAGDITNLDGRVTTVEGTTTSLQNQVTSNDTDITDLQTRMTTAEGDITVVEADVAEIVAALPANPAAKVFRAVKVTATTDSVGYVTVPWTTFGINNSSNDALVWAEVVFSKTSTGDIPGSQEHWASARPLSGGAEFCVYGAENSGSESPMRLARVTGKSVTFSVLVFGRPA